jgi:hypothetical protein
MKNYHYKNCYISYFIYLFFFYEVMTERFYVSSCKLEGLYPMGVRVSLTSIYKNHNVFRFINLMSIIGF